MSDAVELAIQTPLPSSPSSYFLELSDQNDSRQALRNESSLAPADKGFGAWSFLAAAFFVEALIWGFPTAYGIFLDGYLHDPELVNQKHATSLLPLIGTSSSGIIYCSGPIIFPFVSRYPHYRKHCIWLGTLICWLSLFSASYTKNINALVALQGVLYAIGGTLVYSPCVSYLPEWFINRRGLANGVAFAGTAAGGLIIPLVLPRLISAFGTAKSLRILSIFLLCALLPLLPFVKGRLPESRSRVLGPAPRGSRNEWIGDALFWVLIATNTLQGFAYFVPLVWLPTFASDLHLSGNNAALTLAMLNCASVLGQLSMGYLSDRFNPWILALATFFSTSLATFILWGVLSNSFAGLLAFGIAYGTFSGGFTGLWTGFLKPIAKDDHSLVTSLFGYLALTRGIGNILSTPISTALSTMRSDSKLSNGRTGFEVGGGRFEKVIVYVGTCFAGAAGIAVLGWIVDVRKRRGAVRIVNQG